MFIKVRKDWIKYCVYIDRLQDNVMDYLTSIKIVEKKQQHLYTVIEQDLLMNLLSRIIDIEKLNLKICPNHRFIHETGWSIPKSCVFLKEGGNICHLQSNRVAPMHLIQSISTFPYGGQISWKHRTDLYENDKQTIAVTNPVSGVHSWEMITDNIDQINEMLAMLEQSPIKSQASQISIQNQVPGSQHRLISKLRKY